MIKLPFGQRKGSEKLTQSEEARAKRLRRSLKPSTQNTLKYTSLFEDGMLHVTGEVYSETFRLGDVNYITASEEEKVDIIDYYAGALNSLNSANSYQLLILNRQVDSKLLANITYDAIGDGYDDYRQEYNDMIEHRFAYDQNNFKVEKFITVSTSAMDRKTAKRQLNDVGTTLRNQFQGVDITLTSLNGSQRLNIFSDLLRGNPYLNLNYHDIAISGLTTKSFIAPNRIRFYENYMMMDDKFAKIMFIRQYPSFLNDGIVKSLTDIGIELAISIQANPYDIGEAMMSINTAESNVNMDIVKSMRKGFSDGIPEDMAVGGVARETSEAAKKWRTEIQENDQKVFSGVITVFFKADSLEQLNDFSQRIKTAGRKHVVDFEDIYYHQEEALNSVLPIGQVYLDAKKTLMRDMTTSNLATQIPFTNVDLQSESERAIYYGQNQLSNNVITVDRKRDLNTGSGVVLGSSGSGKSVTVKAGEVIPTILKYPEDRVIIVDPEDEYSDIGREFGAQLIDIFVGSNTHLNLMDLPEADRLSSEDTDPIGQKSNLIMGLFENILSEVTDEEFSIIDRVTRLCYEKITDRTPTLKDWHKILKDQEEPEAQNLALKSESYATGSQDIFSYETNVDIESRFIIFNLKKLNHKLKPFALMVIQDYIWNQVVNNQGKVTTHIYFDEMQLQFNTDNQAQFFTELYSRVRKYGAIPTGITQNVETLMAREEGRKLLSNSEFIILLKQKPQDLKVLAETIHLTPALIRYVSKPKAKGTGLIVAGSTVVPFENPIPRDSKLFKLIATDA
ncbi:DUF87 domain-containing protein [Streptococcus suis]|nr:DUF87 domain-containing protein [Streptococcus suis]